MKAALILLAACASPKPPPLAPSLGSLAFYVGSWQCTGTDFERSETWTARVRVAPELDGTWLSVQMLGPGMNRTIEHKGFDPATKKWIHIAVAGDGAWGTLSSTGWSGASMEFVPDDKTDTSRATFTKLDDRRYSHSVSRDGTKLWEKTCTKS